MELLSKLTPAETHLLLHKSKAELKDLMKYTYMDLLFKKVLAPKKVIRQNQNGGKIRTYNYILTGINFNEHKALSHELIYLTPYTKNKSIKILFQHLISMAFENSKGKRRYIQKNLLSSPQLQHYVESSLFHKLFGIIQLNKEGKLARIKIQESINILEKDFHEILISDEERALKILHSIKGNIFLLNNFDFELLKKVDRQLFKEIKKTEKLSDYEFYDFEDYGSFDSYEDSFDSNYDSSEASFSSDSGCSSGGCSGCGGCGGCS